MTEKIISHDEENDILHIIFHNHPLEASGITNTRGDFVFRYKRGALTGVTIMNFSRYEEVIKIIVEHKNRSLGEKMNGKKRDER